MKSTTLKKLSELVDVINTVVSQYGQLVESIDLVDRTLTVTFDADGSDIEEAE